MVLEKRDGARSSLNTGIHDELDPFVRAVLSLWAERDAAESWEEEANADDGTM